MKLGARKGIEGVLRRVLRQVPNLEPIPKVVYSAVPSFGHNAPKKEMHGECSSRITSILRCLEKAKLTPKFRESEIIQLENARTATMEEIQSVHDKSYISNLEQTTEEAKASRKGAVSFPETKHAYVTPKTLEESLVAAGTCLSIVDYVVKAAKSTDIPPIGFALIRPPGHLAVSKGSLPREDCIFNNVAIATRYVQRVHGLKRVFIIDFDVNHGSETCYAFSKDPNVLYLSTHQGTPFESYTGEIDNIGYDNGEGTTINVELPELTGDVSMLHVFDDVIVPAAKKFKPDIILVSAGYNGHVLDGEGEFQMTTGGYYRLSSKIKGLAQILCGGRCVFFLEGGNHLTSLANSVVESFRAFVEDPSMAPNDNFFLDYEPSLKVKQIIKTIKHLHSL